MLRFPAYQVIQLHLLWYCFSIYFTLKISCFVSRSSCFCFKIQCYIKNSKDINMIYNLYLCSIKYFFFFLKECVLAPFKWCVGPDLFVSLFIGGFFSSWAGAVIAACALLPVAMERGSWCAAGCDVPGGVCLCVSISHPGRNHLLGLNFLVSL